MYKSISILILISSYLFAQDTSLVNSVDLIPNDNKNDVDYMDFKRTQITAWALFGTSVTFYALAGALLYEGNKLHKRQNACMQEKKNTTDENDALEICRNYNGLYNLGGYVLLVPGTVLLGVGITIQISAIREKKEYRRHFKVNLESFSPTITFDVNKNCGCH